MGVVGDAGRLDTGHADTDVDADAERTQALTDVATVLHRWEQHRSTPPSAEVRAAARPQPATPSPPPPPWALCVTRLGIFFVAAYALPWLLTGGMYTAGPGDAVVGAAAIVWRTYRTSRRVTWSPGNTPGGPSWKRWHRRGRWRR